PRFINDVAAIPPITMKSATGLLGKKRFPRISNASAARPRTSEGKFVSPTCLMKSAMRCQKLPCAPLKPQNFGSCVLVSHRATPALKPSITVSEINFTIAPARTSQAMNAAAAASKAVHEASAVKRAVSPEAISPKLDPIRREMAEVTLTAVCRELQKSQNTNPEKRTA